MCWSTRGPPQVGSRRWSGCFCSPGGLTAAYMTKLFVAIFVSSRAVGQRPALKDYMSPGTHAALSVGAALLLVLGLTPGLTMEPLAQWAGDSCGQILVTASIILPGST